MTDRISHEEAIDAIKGMADASGWFAVGRKLLAYVAQQQSREEELRKLAARCDKDATDMRADGDGLNYRGIEELEELRDELLDILQGKPPAAPEPQPVLGGTCNCSWRAATATTVNGQWPPPHEHGCPMAAFQTADLGPQPTEDDLRQRKNCAGCGRDANTIQAWQWPDSGQMRRYCSKECWERAGAPGDLPQPPAAAEPKKCPAERLHKSIGTGYYCCECGYSPATELTPPDAADRPVMLSELVGVLKAYKAPAVLVVDPIQYAMTWAACELERKGKR